MIVTRNKKHTTRESLVAVIDKSACEAVAYYTDHMAPLLKLRYRACKRDFDAVCPTDEDKAMAFQICWASIAEASKDKRLTEEGQENALAEQDHAIRLRDLQHHFGCNESKAESIIRIYELTDAAQRVEKGFKHTPKETRGPYCMECTPAYQDLYAELMDHSGIQERYAEHSPALTPDALSLKGMERTYVDSDMVVSDMMHEFMLDMVARNKEPSRFPSWRKQHAAEIRSYSMLMTEHNSDLVSSYPFYDYAGYVGQWLEKHGIAGDAVDTLQEVAVRTMRKIISDHQNTGEAFHEDELWKKLEEYGIGREFRENADENVRVIMSLTLLSQTETFMAEYLRCTLAKKFGSPREQAQAAKQQQHSVNAFEKIIEAAHNNLQSEESLESARMVANVWCQHADRVAEHVAKLHALAPGRG